MADKGFGGIRHYPPGAHVGVLVIRPDQDGIGPALELLRLLLTTCDLEAMKGASVVATPVVRASAADSDKGEI